MTNPKDVLRYYVSGAIERGEATPIIEQRAQHTPGPWIVVGDCEIMPAADGDNDSIALVSDRPDDGEMEANAEFIVRACNAHDDLIAALESIAERPLADREDDVIDELNRIVRTAQDAIAKARRQA